MKRSMTMLAVCAFALALVGCKNQRELAAECATNLRHIQGGKEQWAIENKKRETDTPSRDELWPNAYLKEEPTCPGGGKYSINVVGQKASCSIPGHNL